MSEMIELVALAVSRSASSVGPDPEMVQRVARAICYAVSLQSDSGVAPKWSDFRSEAVAAITAMREPTEAMWQASEGAIDEFSSASPGGQYYRAMIDAALS